ncbi:molybdate ABC transporter substrate-binding protein [Aggregicoccus sp. 17bor-14]|uniref:molybdate ABC transporter substrate-binding protein n=1 Tax=Myxococcaceae TaxID=31 RepID=UPI00129CDAFA|nr:MULTISPECIES: molybdate ABC transporter substrate-binding protein [Myxococcaceae]MBF5046278.1 molybdate ABC transporter substrate-binding protein [Simulacricoccus sp. 17bor-14]MRI92000.1 molybdate ABC transporter substrate-binding protein [Aggregicoccus sp. 17bor-14]
MRPLLLLPLLPLLAAFGARPASEDAEQSPVLVFAAASTADALQELGRAFEHETGRTVRFAFGASSDLARQVAAGAPADAFLSADEAQLERAASSGRLVTRTRVPLLSNRLVVVVPSGAQEAPRDAAGLLKLPRLALADPQAVPAGVYARNWLQGRGLWAQLAARVVPTVDVRAALAAVETGRVAAAVVYATDAAHSKRVRVAFEVPTSESPRIVYPAAALTGGHAPAGGEAFVRFLQSPAARAVFLRHGFGSAAHP